MKKVLKTLLKIVGGFFGIIIIISTIGIIFADDPEPAVNTNKEEVVEETNDTTAKEAEPEEVIQEEVVSPGLKQKMDNLKDNQSIAYIGDSVSNNRFRLYIEDIRIVHDLDDDVDGYVLVIETTIENKCDETIGIDTDLVSVYGDDYSIDQEDALAIMKEYPDLGIPEEEFYREIDAGRKAKYWFKKKIVDNWADYDYVEVTIGTSVFVPIKDGDTLYYNTGSNVENPGTVTTTVPDSTAKEDQPMFQDGYYTGSDVLSGVSSEQNGSYFSADGNNNLVVDITVNNGDSINVSFLGSTDFDFENMEFGLDSYGGYDGYYDGGAYIITFTNDGFYLGVDTPDENDPHKQLMGRYQKN